MINYPIAIFITAQSCKFIREQYNIIKFLYTMLGIYKLAVITYIQTRITLEFH